MNDGTSGSSAASTSDDPAPSAPSAPTAPLPRAAAIVVAAGAGTRFGGPKQFAELGGRTAVEWSVRTAAAVCDVVVVVLPPATRTCDALRATGATVVAGGRSRPESVSAGLSALAAAGTPETDVVVVHDAARPGATAAMFEAVIAAVADGADGAVPVLPVRDTIKRVVGSGPGAAAGASRIAETLDRSDTVLAQTPQAFRRAALATAHTQAACRPSDEAFTDDAAMVEACGGVVVAVPGDPAAHKITTAADLATVSRLMGIDAPGAPALR